MTTEKELVIAERYRLVEQLREKGGMGVLWVADDLQLGHRVAVKVPDRDHQDEESLKRFAREPRLAAQIGGNNVIKVLDSGTLDDGVPYIVMELLEGSDLAHFIENRAPCGLVLTNQILEQIVRGLGRAHAINIIHRDVKPGNIYVTPERDGTLSIKILDFGIAKDTASDATTLTKTKVSMGSPAYMSPEQLSNARDVKAATDQWALGGVIFELLTGQAPFGGANEHVIIHNIMECKYPRATKLQPSLPAAVDEFFVRVFQREPANRFASVEDLGRAFAEIAKSSAPTQLAGRVPTTPLVRTGGVTQISRRPSKSALSGKSIGAVIALALLAGGGTYIYNEKQRAADAQRAQDAAEADAATQRAKDDATAAAAAAQAANDDSAAAASLARAAKDDAATALAISMTRFDPEISVASGGAKAGSDTAAAAAQRAWNAADAAAAAARKTSEHAAAATSAKSDKNAAIAAAKSALTAKDEAVTAAAGARRARSDTSAAADTARSAKDDAERLKKKLDREDDRTEKNKERVREQERAAAAKAAEAAAKAWYPPSETLRATLVAAVKHSDNVEKQAVRTGNESRLSDGFTAGKYMANLKAVIADLKKNGLYRASELQKWVLQSIAVSADQRRAKLDVIESWETSYYSRATDECKAHQHVHPIPQTIYLAVDANGNWKIDDVDYHNQKEPEFVKCHDT